MTSMVPHIASNEVVARFFVLSLDESFMSSLENASDTVCKWKYDKSKLAHFLPNTYLSIGHLNYCEFGS